MKLYLMIIIIHDYTIAHVVSFFWYFSIILLNHSVRILGKCQKQDILYDLYRKNFFSAISIFNKSVKWYSHNSYLFLSVNVYFPA